MAERMNDRAGRQYWKGRVAAALLVVGGLAVTAGTTGASASLHSHAKSVIISTLKTAKYGTILVSGHTVYTLKPSAVKCAKACYKIWPPVLLPSGVARATAGTGVSAAKLGTVKDALGARQVTYGGKPLFWYFKDTASGQVKGVVTDTWGKWSDVVLVKPVHPVTTTTTSGGGGGVGF